MIRLGLFFSGLLGVLTLVPISALGQPAQAEATGAITKPPDIVVAHYRGKDGIPFPSKISPVAKVDPNELYRTLLVLVSEQGKLLKENMTVPSLPNCTKNERKVEKAKVRDKRIKDKVFLDMLFIKESDIPPEPRKAFGLFVDVQPYFTSRPNSPSLFAKNIKVPCLPYRMRVTGSNTFYLFGKEALKNFDGKPNGKGKYLAEFVEVNKGSEDTKERRRK